MVSKRPKKRNINTKSPASLFGQIIGDAFEHVVINFIEGYLAESYPDYELLKPQEGKHTITLNMAGGLKRQMDNVVIPKDSDDPVALLETKWLKDARHHNDKGAWILQLREVRKRHATIRGAAAILSGYWTEGVGVMLRSEGGIKMVLVATDEQVYSTLQGPLDEFLRADTFTLDAATMRESYPRPRDLLKLAIFLEETGELDAIAASWLEFDRLLSSDGVMLKGSDLIKSAIDELLAPLPANPTISRLEVALQIDTGNTIYEEFSDVEDVIEFLTRYWSSPQEILGRITPKKKQQ
ncbi:MAG: hypothetical protein KBH93_08545 [Anaerolineae bacterium]|nr:hypothetical protein [Anaerolineae bacterium]